MASNIEKEKVLFCQFITKTQISTLLDTTDSKIANKVFYEVRKQINEEGKLLFHKNRVPKYRVVKILEIDEDEIHRNAELERKINNSLK